jgi:hypothetical protein
MFYIEKGQLVLLVEWIGRILVKFFFSFFSRQVNTSMELKPPGILLLGRAHEKDEEQSTINYLKLKVVQ